MAGAAPVFSRSLSVFQHAVGQKLPMAADDNSALLGLGQAFELGDGPEDVEEDQFDDSLVDDEVSDDTSPEVRVY